MTARSIASLRRARTRPKIARKPSEPEPLDEVRRAAAADRGMRRHGDVGGRQRSLGCVSTRGASPWHGEAGVAVRRRRPAVLLQGRPGPCAARPARAPRGGVHRRRVEVYPPLSIRHDMRPPSASSEEGPDMPRIVRGALVQATWTGDKESMIQKHEERAHEAAKDGAQVILFQELFYGPYFCQVQDAQYYSYTELIPDGPTTKRMQDLAKQTGHGHRRADVRGGRAGVGHLLQHGRGHRRGRDVSRQVPQDAHPAREGLLGEVLFPARESRATRSSRRPSARSASTSATTGTSPRARARSG